MPPGNRITRINLRLGDEERHQTPGNGQSVDHIGEGEPAGDLLVEVLLGLGVVEALDLLMESELDAFDRGVEGDEGGRLGGVLQGKLVGLAVASAPPLNSKRMGG